MVRLTSPEPGHPLVLVKPEGDGSLAAIDRALVIDQYTRHGALLFRGFDAALPAFETFARRFCASLVVNESPGRTPLDPARQIYSVDGGANAFPLHPEISREPWKPDVALFTCLKAPAQGGRTTLCDGIALAAALPAALRAELERRRLVYIQGVWPEVLAFWLGASEPDDALLHNPPSTCPYQFARLPDGRLIRHFSRPFLHRPMFADARAFGNFLLFARFNNGRPDFPLLDDLTPVPEDWLQLFKATGEALTYAHEWEEGDVLMVDNTRFMHGRTTIADPADRVIATIFGYLDFARPDADEVPDALWRRGDFVPPRPPEHMVKRS